MSLLTSYKPLGDNELLTFGDTVGIELQFNFLPFTEPTDDEIRNVFLNVADLGVSTIERSVLSRLSSGVAQMTIVGKVASSNVAAGTLRGEVLNAMNVLAGSRASGLWNVVITSIGRPINVITGTPEDGDSSGFPVSTTIIIVAVVVGIVAIASVARKVT